MANKKDGEHLQAVLIQEILKHLEIHDLQFLDIEQLQFILEEHQNNQQEVKTIIIIVMKK